MGTYTSQTGKQQMQVRPLVEHRGHSKWFAQVKLDSPHVYVVVISLSLLYGYNSLPCLIRSSNYANLLLHKLNDLILARNLKVT